MSVAEFPEIIVAGLELMATVGGITIPTTVKSKAGNEALTVWLSVTVITIPEVVPTSPLPGVPVRAPVEVSKLAHTG